MSQLDLFGDVDRPWELWPIAPEDLRSTRCPKCRKSTAHGNGSGPIRVGETLVGWYQVRYCCGTRWFQPAYTCCKHCATSSPYHPLGADTHSRPCGCPGSRQVQA